MARPGRPPNTEPTGEWKLHIPLRLQAEVDLRLLDPLRGRPRHGARSRLVSLLLKEWLENRVNIPDLFGFEELEDSHIPLRLEKS